LKFAGLVSARLKLEQADKLWHRLCGLADDAKPHELFDLANA
jgi:hypothetical protein